MHGRVRHLVLLAAPWLAGIWLGHATAEGHPLPGAGAVAWGLVAVAAGCTWRGAKIRTGLLCTVLVCVTAGAGWIAGRGSGGAASPPAEGLARIEARVLRCDHGTQDAASSLLVVQRGARLRDGRRIRPGIRLRAGPLALPVGARIVALAQVKPASRFRNPSPHPPWPHPRVDGLAYLSGPASLRVVSIGTIDASIDRVRTALRTRLELTLQAPYAAVARALLLGERRAVPEEIARDVTGAGLAHLLAVSGLHISLLVGACLWALRFVLLRVPAVALRLPPGRLACALAAPLALLLAGVCGAGPSAMRAAQTAALGWGLQALGRRPDAVALAASAALLITAQNPAQAARVGLVLSVVATAAIVSLSLEGTGPGKLRGAFDITVRSSLATAPVVLWCFGSFPWAGLLTNLVGVPFFSLAVLPAAALHGLTTFLLPNLAGLTAAVFEAGAGAGLSACRFVAHHIGSWQPPPLTLAQGALLTTSCLLLLAPRLRARARWLGVAACCLGWCVAEVQVRRAEQPQGRLRITFLDVGQGDAALVDLPDGRLALIDAGGAVGGGPDPGQHVLRPILAARRRSRIDLAVLSHPHPDHYGGLRELTVPITTLWDSGQAEAEADIFDAHKPAVDLLAARRASGTRVLTPSALCGKPRDFGGLRVSVLWPCPAHDSTLSANDNSLVLKLTYGRFSVLMTGDIEQAAEAALVASLAPLQADVLKVPHHGSRTSSTAAFLARVAPSAAIISAGRFNRYGHPHAEVVARLGRTGGQIVALAERGGTIFETDGTTAELRSYDGTHLVLPQRAAP